MKSKFPGKCKRCNNEWKIDDEIYMEKKSEKHQWSKCTSEQCVKDQLATAEEKQQEEQLAQGQKTLNNVRNDDIDYIHEKLDAHGKMLNEIIRLLADMKLQQMDKEKQ